MRSSIVILLLMVAVAQAATVTVSPTSIYETTQPWITIDVDNYGGNAVVDEVEAESQQITVTNAQSYSGWTTTYDSSSALWKDGSIETNIKSSWFEFQLQAPNLTADRTETITIDLDGATTNFNITILNDATPPNITNIIPTNYARANINAQTTSMDVTDTETGVSSVSYSFNDCTSGNTSVTLTKSNNTYFGVADFSSYDEGESACYTINAANNAGESSTITGTLLFDGTAPTLSLISPTIYATENTDFVFNATDNIATTLACTLYLDSTTLATISAPVGVNTNNQDLSNVSEGAHTWSVDCADGVGLTASATKSIIVDTQDPNVTSTVPPAIPRTQNIPISVQITDVSGISSLVATFNGQTVNLTQNGTEYTGTISSNTLGSEVFRVTAIDNAGHTQSYNRTVDIVPNHILSLTLNPGSTQQGNTVTATGALTVDGNTTIIGTTVTVLVASQSTVTNLNNNSYSTTFSAPADGTYSVTALFDNGIYTYLAVAQLTVDPSGNQQSSTGYSSGFSSDWQGGEGYILPSSSGEGGSSGGSNGVIPDPPITTTLPPDTPVYTPLPPEAPRTGITPQGTGIFNLGSNINWLAPLLALIILASIGSYAYYRRKPPQDGMNWDGYFK